MMATRTHILKMDKKKLGSIQKEGLTDLWLQIGHGSGQRPLAVEMRGGGCVCGGRETEMMSAWVMVVVVGGYHHTHPHNLVL